MTADSVALHRAARRTIGPWLAMLALATSAVIVPAAAHEVSCGRTNVTGGDWRRFGNQLTGDRNQSSEHVLDGASVPRLAPAWTFDANRWTLTENNEITGYPIVADGCVFVGSSTGVQTSSTQHPGWVFAINADTGELVWRTRVDGGVFSTLAVEDGVVYAFVSRVSTPFVIALDQATGHELWSTVVDHQIGSDAVSSPIVYDGHVWVGVSGTAAEGDEADRLGFEGNYVILKAGIGGGQIEAKTYTIPEELWEEGYAGGAIWSTIAIDPSTGYGYVGTGNPFDYNAEHENTNAVLKVDMDDSRDTFGEIVGSYKGNVEQYFPELSDTAPCEELEEVDNVFAGGFECAHLDLDFGAMANLFTDADGRRLVGIGQKSGVYHVFDADTMEPVWTSLLGFPSAVGGIVGSAAYDGQNFYGPHTIGGYIWSITKADGSLRWVQPIADGVHWGNPMTYANRIVYTADLKGFLNAYDAATGLPLLARPIPIGSETREDPAITWGGVTVARNAVFVSIGVGLTSAGLTSMPNGFVVAFRPLAVGT